MKIYTEHFISKIFKRCNDNRTSLNFIKQRNTYNQNGKIKNKEGDENETMESGYVKDYEALWIYVFRVLVYKWKNLEMKSEMKNKNCFSKYNDMHWNTRGSKL